MLLLGAPVIGTDSWKMVTGVSHISDVLSRSKFYISCLPSLMVGFDLDLCTGTVSFFFLVFFY